MISPSERCRPPVFSAQDPILDRITKTLSLDEKWQRTSARRGALVFFRSSHEPVLTSPDLRVVGRLRQAMWYSHGP